MKKIVCMASKVYAYQLVNTQTGEEKIVTKFKGVVLNSTTSRVVNMEAMEDSVIEFLLGEPKVLTAPDMSMRRSKVMGDVTTTRLEKKLKPVMDKVRVLSDGKTLPAGFNANCHLVEDFPY